MNRVVTDLAMDCKKESRDKLKTPKSVLGIYCGERIWCSQSFLCYRAPRERQPIEG